MKKYMYILTNIDCCARLAMMAEVDCGITVFHHRKEVVF